ncbi:NAD(P)H-dependent oxidoreductase [Robertkochia solimangrovi]|uniref:NAD(P)H-dependent oxidoreductase n=1 Tax=Robertkochia solimangrovi TaxID=2213046 RepID=UPI00117DEBC8|nr:NAD(P)H-dependent oxidoreductase [Robertkochia solimangrovi]TRZ41475.1 NAD(P)H-dependent oxidoreductase [Robertkochia solimangrovi]
MTTIENSTFIDNMNWRYATKKFNAEKKLSEAELEILTEAIRLSPSSYGLQPYKVFVITDPELRAELQKASFMQPQITDASQLIVFANQLNFGSEEIQSYIENIADTRKMDIKNLDGFSQMMNNQVNSLPEDVKNNWTAKQAYIALGNLLAAAANLHIDACPMEGFDAAKYNEILNLKSENLNACLVAAIGYRDADDETQHYTKVRKSKQELFINL